MTDFLVTGADGQLGRAVTGIVGSEGASVVGTSHEDLSVEDGELVRQRISAERPAWVIHCAAWTDVDGCELDPQRADLINGQGTANVVRACQEVAAGLIYVSTDFVFDGASCEAYSETVEPNPISVYGRSKLLGEESVLAASQPNFFIVRTSWVFGPGGKNFVGAILARAQANQPLRVVDDQVGSPTMTHDLAQAILELQRAEPAPGIYHASNEGTCSWHDFACEILRRAGIEGISIDRISSSELDRPAARPAYSVLDCSKLASVRGCSLPDWREGLDRYLAESL
ncbi:MAG: dTDP-4-dehydrorhamnose reductase [Planctomycetota bacterium]|jgi:dTDP-4-dehydrorhamnose reductase|nr:dTDP-4-dehydrorhamnose reductase [Planctomycetota bacterium]